MRQALMVLACGLISACGGSGGDGATTNQAAAPVGGTPTQAMGDCSGLPDFVTFYSDARAKACMPVGAVKPHHRSGTIMFATDLAKADVIAWYRDRAHAAGLKDSIANPGMMYSARDGDKRSMMVIVNDGDANGKTSVQINWGYDTQ